MRQHIDEIEREGEDNSGTALACNDIERREIAELQGFGTLAEDFRRLEQLLRSRVFAFGIESPWRAAHARPRPRPGASALAVDVTGGYPQVEHLAGRASHFLAAADHFAAARFQRQPHGQRGRPEARHRDGAKHG